MSKNTRQNLFLELIKALKQVEKGEVVQEEHRTENGEHFTKRIYETTVLNPKGNMSVKIVVHSWWGRR